MYKVVESVTRRKATYLVAGTVFSMLFCLAQNGAATLESEEGAEVELTTIQVASRDGILQDSYPERVGGPAIHSDPAMLPNARTRPYVTADVMKQPTVPFGSTFPSDGGAGTNGLVEPPSAEARPAQSAGKPGVGVRADDLSIAERLKIKVLGHTDLSGDYIINIDHTLSLPMIGRISIANMNVSMLEEVLAKEVSALTKHDAYVTVEVAKYRPIFVTGSVMMPGAHEWKPGTNVLQAVSLSGGMFRETSRSQSAGSDPQSRLVTVKQATTNLKLSLSVLARLRAEQNGSDVIEIPDRLVELFGQGEAEEAIDTQKSKLENQRSVMKSQVGALELERESAKLELAALETQRGMLEKQLLLNRSIMNDIEGLWANKTIGNNRYLTAKSDLFEVEAKNSENLVAIARAKTRVLALERQILNLKHERYSQINDRIEGLEREIAQSDITIDAAGETATASSSENQTITYHVAVKDGAGSKTIEADQFTSLMPGDILIVTSGNARPTPVSALEPRGGMTPRPH